MAEEQQSTASKPESRPPRPDSRDQRPRGRPGGGRRFFRRKKVDYFSVNKIDDINYKDVDVLKQFIGDRGKILPRRHTGLGAMHQRKLKIAIKRARNIALLPFAGGSDMLRSPKVEAKPAEAKAGETAAVEAKTAETKVAEAKTAETKVAEAKTAETKATEAKTAETKTTETKAVESKAAETEPVESKDDKPASAEASPAAESKEG